MKLDIFYDSKKSQIIKKFVCVRVYNIRLNDISDESIQSK